ncbi:MAG: 30S ribosomal protein S20 [Gammaproteobacteria bacterium]|nr:30S ribosomal protein S20 [Gammaproteobacteria bacterium]MCW8888046.1 30S ribosomal protein S20 [Gammaproteobacteria bacterium]MCW8983398.1 30S ribosomal protein S20 [Gammaproteobacteria bacterium]
MANSAQARKRARQADKRRTHNAAQRATLRTTIKNVIKAVAAGNKDDAAAAYKVAVPAIDKGVTKGHLHKNAAARYKSRLNNRVRAM